MVTFGAAAQNDSIMDIRPQGSELRIEAAGFGITIGQGETPRYSASYHRRARQPRVTTSLGIASIDLGFNTLPDVRYYGPWAGQGDFLDIRAGKSIRFAWEPAAVEVSLDRLPRAEWGSRGPSRVEFLYRPGAGLTARPLRKIASGGEVSRVMLAVKVVLGEADACETLVFDEVAERHYLVEKRAGEGGVPETTLTEIAGEDRVAEIARMLSGDTGEASRDLAREMLAGASRR